MGEKVLKYKKNKDSDIEWVTNDIKGYHETRKKSNKRKAKNKIAKKSKQINRKKK